MGISCRRAHDWVEYHTTALGMGGTIVSDTNRIEVEFDERRYLALQNEAQRLGVDIPQIVTRATSAWICEMADNTVLCTASPSATAQ